jgi:hypothetical protein
MRSVVPRVRRWVPSVPSGTLWASVALGCAEQGALVSSEETLKCCSACREEKPLDNFHRNASKPDGRGCYCKPCTKIRARAWYQENRKLVAEASRRRFKEKSQERVKADFERRRERHPEKVRARTALSVAIHRGKIAKPSQCSVCKRETESKELHGHHEDYDKPLEVEWLCFACHLAEHGKEVVT